MSTYRGSITLTSISEGRGYGIETNHEKLNKFYVNNNNIEYSPESITINAYILQNDEKSILDVSNYTLEIWPVNESGVIGAGVFSLLNGLTGKRIGYSGDYEPLLPIVRTVSDNKYITFNFETLTEYDIPRPAEPTEEQAEVINKFDTLIDLIQNKNFYFLLKIYPYVSNYEVREENVLAIKPIVFEFGTSEDMAKFALTASSIQAAINNTGMIFDADGLTITNGGFRIQKEGTNPEVLLQYNEGKLEIKGTGTFTGEIEATGGSFTGEVTAETLTANNGLIGGFHLTSDGLFSHTGYNENADPPEAESNLKLYGDSGLVVANTITLGIGASIADYLQLGSAFLYNPNEHGRKLIEAGNITLTDTGVFSVGDIILDGVNSKIFGTNFTITPDWSEFNNVSVKGKIVTAVFETDKIQAAGGTMLFKPSYKVKSQNGNVLTLEEEFTGSAGDYIYLVQKEGTFLTDKYLVGSIDNSDNKKITLTSVSDPNSTIDKPIFSVVDIGKAGEAIIGVNSGDGTIQGVLYPRGITISEMDTNNVVSVKTFLGDLGKLGKAGLSGNGLYGENVFLTGSLTTKTNSSSGVSYAGVNTLNGAKANIFEGQGVKNDTSEIIFWAGSNGITEPEIQNSPFQVTRDGSVYASQGIFNGSIISNSQIRGTDIYAARIHGTGYSNDGQGNITPGLSFYNTVNGIAFFNGEYQQNPVQTFYMGSNGLAYGSGSEYFIKINGSEVGSVFNDILINSIENEQNIPKLELTGNKIYGKYGDSNAAYIELNSNANIKIDNTHGISIAPSQLQLIHGETLVTGVFNLGDKLQYKQVIENDVLVGYNLYVK